MVNNHFGGAGIAARPVQCSTRHEHSMPEKPIPAAGMFRLTIHVVVEKKLAVHVRLPYRMRIYTEINIANLPRMVKFTELNIRCLNSSYISHH